MVLLRCALLPVALAGTTLVWKGTAVFSRGSGRGSLYLL